MRILLALVLLAPLAAVDRPAWQQALLPQGEGWQASEQHLRFNNGAEPQTLDPQVMTGVPEANLAEALFEGLTALHPQTLQPVPGAAESWEVADDGLAWTFHLRPDLRWSDGTPLTAADFVRSWRRVLMRSTASQYANMLFPVAGAAAFHAAAEQDDAAWAQVGVQAADARTLHVRLADPCAYFLSLTAFHTLFPVPPTADDRGEWLRPGRLIGNGPFLLSEWAPRERIVLTPNPHWHDRGLVKLQRVTAFPYDDLETALKLYRQGALDWMNAVPLPRLDELRLDPDYYVTPYLGIYYIRCNVSRGPLADARLRRALALAIDRREITQHLLRAGQLPMGSFCPDATAGYRAPAGLGCDVRAAQALLAEAGFAGGAGLPHLELLYNTSDQHQLVCENLAAQWRRNLGLTVVPRNTEWKVYLTRLTSLDYDLARSGWIGDYVDPTTFFDIWRSGDGNNRTGWGDPAYDALLRQAAAERDPARRLELFGQLDATLIAQVPGIPIYTYVNQGMLAEHVRGLHHNLRDLHPLQYVWIERAAP